MLDQESCVSDYVASVGESKDSHSYEISKLSYTLHIPRTLGYIAFRTRRPSFQVPVIYWLESHAGERMENSVVCTST